MDMFSKLLAQINVPCANDNVYKEECVYSFDNPVIGHKRTNNILASVGVMLMIWCFSLCLLGIAHWPVR